MLNGVNEVGSDEVPVVWWSSLERTSYTVEFQAAWNKNSQNHPSELLLTDITALATQNAWFLPYFSHKTNLFISKIPSFGSTPVLLLSLSKCSMMPWASPRVAQLHTGNLFSHGLERPQYLEHWGEGSIHTVPQISPLGRLWLERQTWLLFFISGSWDLHYHGTQEHVCGRAEGSAAASHKWSHHLLSYPSRMLPCLFCSVKH